MAWTVIRVSGGTAARLRALREKLLRGDDRRKLTVLQLDLRDRVGLDQVIEVLLDREERHEERKRASARRRSLCHQQGPPLPTEPGMVPPGPGPASAPSDAGGA